MISNRSSATTPDGELNDLDYMSYLNNLDDKDKWPFIRQWMKDSPHDFFRVLRQTKPIYKTTECILLALYDDVVEALNHPKVFTVALYKPKMGDFLMTEDESPMHNGDREIMMSLLQREDIPRIREYVAKSLVKYWIAVMARLI